MQRAAHGLHTRHCSFLFHKVETEVSQTQSHPPEQATPGWSATQACRSTFIAGRSGNLQLAAGLLHQAERTTSNSSLASALPAATALIRLSLWPREPATAADEPQPAAHILQTAKSALQGWESQAASSQRQAGAVIAHALLGLGACSSHWPQHRITQLKADSAALSTLLETQGSTQLPRKLQAASAGNRQHVAFQAMCWRAAVCASPCSSSAWMAAGQWYQHFFVRSSPSSWLSTEAPDSSATSQTEAAIQQPHSAKSAPAASQPEHESACMAELIRCYFKALAHAASGCRGAEQLAALLVLLRLLKAHAGHVSSLFMQYHREVPPGTWHQVTPQCFALLHHPQVPIPHTDVVGHAHVHAFLQQTVRCLLVLLALQSSAAAGLHGCGQQACVPPPGTPCALASLWCVHSLGAHDMSHTLAGAGQAGCPCSAAACAIQQPRSHPLPCSSTVSSRCVLASLSDLTMSRLISPMDVARHFPCLGSGTVMAFMIGLHPAPFVLLEMCLHMQSTAMLACTAGCRHCTPTSKFNQAFAAVYMAILT